MRKLMFLLILFATAKGWAQTSDSIPVSDLNYYDSMLYRTPAPDSITIKRDVERNMTSLLNLQKKHRARQRRNAVIRIGIGIAFLAVLIIGLKRKKTLKW